MNFKVKTRWAQAPKAGEKDLAEISMHLGGRALTQLLDVKRQEVRDFVRASAVTLALWWVDNWWRLRWEPIPHGVTADWRLRHEITSASGGTTWPPMMIYGVGQRVVLAPIPVGAEIGGPVEHLPMIVSIMSGRTYEEGLDEFFQTVIQACLRAQDGSALNTLVEQLNVERADTDVSAWRRLEARLGYDADQAPDGLIERLLQQEGLVGPEAVEEAAIAHPGDRAPETLEKVLAASHASELKIDVAAAAAVAEPRDHVDLNRPTWMLAELAAVRLRRAVGRPGGPLLNKALSEVLGVGWERVKAAPATAFKLPYGARLRSKATVEKIALKTVTQHDRRFELARVLGDAVWIKDAKFGVISRGRTDRQKFQRAFAQSLLCPFDDLRNHVDLTGPTEEQIESAARRYHVHRSVVRTLLVNKGFLPRETLAEQLEAA